MRAIFQVQNKSRNGFFQSILLFLGRFGKILRIAKVKCTYEIDFCFPFEHSAKSSLVRYHTAL